MTNLKVKTICVYNQYLENSINDFLSKLDISQIVKIYHYTLSESKGMTMIYYVDYEDVRNIKIDYLTQRL